MIKQTGASPIESKATDVTPRPIEDKRDESKCVRGRAIMSTLVNYRISPAITK
jgi:hypothetical protein